MTGDFVKKKIEKAGIQLNSVAEKLNISPQNFHSKLKVRDIRVSFLIEIANAINKPIEYFFDQYHTDKEYSLSACIAEPDKQLSELRKECYEKGNRIIALLDENAELRKEIEEMKNRGQNNKD